MTNIPRILPAAAGGTGIKNSSTITLGGAINTANNFSTVGNFALTLTQTGATNVTLPTSGTLATTTQVVTYQAATLTLTSAQVLALRATPIQIVAAPGAGKVIRPVCCDVKMTYGGTNAFTNGQNFTLKHGSGSGTSMGTVNTASMLNGTTTAYTINNVMMGSNSVAATIMENQSLVVQNGGASEITGNAAGDNTVTVTLLYYILSL